jgi:hypothetical protein
MANDEATAGLWQVFDLNQQGPENPPRHHEVGGKSWPLYRDRPTLLPPHLAAIFQRDPAFRVLDENGQEQVTLPDAENIDAAKRRPHLNPGETIAKFEELTSNALLARAALRPGGSGFTAKSKRADMIGFLTDAPMVSELREHEKARGSGSEAGVVPGSEELSDADTKKMLEGG